MKGGRMKDNAEGCKILWCRLLLGGREGERRGRGRNFSDL
jgi:hypothetical protein